MVERDKVKILERITITVKWQDENVIVIEVDDNELKAGDKVITTPIDYATNGQQLREAGDPLPGPPPGSGKGKAPKGKKKKTAE